MRTISAFTIIELLMVMMLSSILGSLALSAFIDFRNDAKVASLRQSLSAIRKGIQNQIQQARLRCGVSNPDTHQTTPGSPFWIALYGHLFTNDITNYYNYGASTPYKVCSLSQITNPADRKFWSISTSERARNITNGVPQPTREMPANPFVSGNNIYDLAPTSSGFIQLYGGPCEVADYFRNSFGESIHWFYNSENGDVFPGTNTPGINECNF